MRTNLLQFQDYPQDIPLDSLDSSDDRLNQTPKDKSWLFNNSNLCQCYGQENIEKCLFILFFLIVFSASILYHYYAHFENIIFGAICCTIFFNLFSFITYSVCLYKLRSGEMFDSMPTAVLSVNDSIIVLNFLCEIIVLLMVGIYSKLDWFCFSLFAGKLLLKFLLEYILL